jgi:hypothetical protein
MPRSLTSLLTAGAVSTSLLLTSCTQEEFALVDGVTTGATVIGSFGAAQSVADGRYNDAQGFALLAGVAQGANRVANNYADRDTSRQNTEIMANAIQNQNPQIVVINQQAPPVRQVTSSLQGIILRDKIQVQHNIFQNGKKGMIITAPFRIINGKGRGFRIGAAFGYVNSQGGLTALEDDGDGRYCSGDKTVTTLVRDGEELVSTYKDATFDSPKMFMPYYQLNLNSSQIVKFTIILYEGDAQSMDVLDVCTPNTPFQYNP